MSAVALGIASLLCIACSGGDATPTAPGGSPPTQDPAKTPATPAAGGAAVQASSVKVDMSLVTMFFGSEPMAPKVRNRGKERAALGKELYHDKRLSRNGDISCASCHALDNWGQDGKPTSPGTGGAAGRRNTPTTFNAFRQFKQFWDYRADTVEQQATMPILTAIEHGLKDEAEIESILGGIPEYAEAFQKAFPKDEKPISAKNVGMAIGAFERTLVTRSRWDDFLDGKADALTDLEKEGLNTFVEVRCITCHTSRLAGGAMMQKLGLILPVKSEDQGRFEVTQNPGEKMFFKVPQLLNVEKTGPYMHDGSIKTLEEVTEYMAKHQLGTTLKKAQTDAIVAFMKALTGKPQW